MPPVKKLLKQALSLHSGGSLSNAKNIYRSILSTEPRQFSVLTLLGTLYLQEGNWQEGIKLVTLSLSINPLQPNAYNNRGNALKDLGHYDEALGDYDQAIALKPDFAEAHYNRAGVLKNLKRNEEALASYTDAIAAKPDYAKAYNNRGNLLRDLGRYDEALADHARAIGLAPGVAEIHDNRGNVLAEMGRHDEALANYDRALDLDPNSIDAHYDKSLIKILKGDWEEGWKLYEWRWKRSDARPSAREFRQPRWSGAEDLTGKTILLYAEQGLGDIILFCRYARLAEARGAEVILEVPRTLAALAATVSRSVRVVATGDALPAFDYHCPLMSLPLAFGTAVDKVPAETPYLAADAQKQKQWRERLGQKTRPRIGLAWTGSGAYTNKKDSRRDIPFAAFQRLLGGDRDYICLQKEITSEDRQLLAGHPRVRTFDNALNDFSDTAALVAEMDLVVTVDTAVAHLAGALGKRVWVLLPDPPDFMWMLEREDSLWYPAARLFRQPRHGDWDSMLARVVREMNGFQSQSS
jgi:tetratricopeptide (TPR) repeat protein